MASRKTLSADNLETLGVARLAELLIEVSQGNAAIKRRLTPGTGGRGEPCGGCQTDPQALGDDREIALIR